MRDILNLLDKTLFESRGLGARRNGEEFVSLTNPNDKIFFDSATFYPDGGGSFSTPEETAAQLNAVVKSLRNSTVEILAKFKSNDLGFGVATFKNINGEKITFIKPFHSINPDPTQNPWSNQTGIPGYRYNSKVAAKSQAGLMPQDILTQPSDLSPGEIVEQIAAKFGDKSPLTSIAQQLADGANFPITIKAPEGIEFSAFTNYFCELLHPISLLMGSASGNANDAAKEFLGPAGFMDANNSISFGTDKTEGLSDSIIHNEDGKKLKISSKAAVGAAASAKNLLDLSREVKTVQNKKQTEVLQIIESVIHSGARNAPLVLGKYYNLISEKDEKDIMAMYKQPLTSMKAAEKLPVSKNLKRLMTERTPENPNSVNLYYHCIASVAGEVADYINENTDFSKVASDLLNSGALIQVNTIAKDHGNTWTVSKFNAVWPSKATTGVKFSSKKNYFSTGIKGNFTFKILRNGAQDVEDESNNIADVVPAISINDDDYEAPRSNLKASDTIEKPARSTKAADLKKFGRTKQR